jgi:hypothetical protein
MTAYDRDMAFETEKAHYQQLLPELLKAHKGEYAVFKDDDFLGVFPTNGEAYTAALHRYGITSFLLQPIREKEPIRRLTNVLLVPTSEEG